MHVTNIYRRINTQGDASLVSVYNTYVGTNYQIADVLEPVRLEIVNLRGSLYQKVHVI